MTRSLPPRLAEALRPVLPDLAEETIAAIGRGVPAYARPLEGPFGKTLRIGVERALVRFVDEIGREGGDGFPEPPRELYLQLGRGEFRAGRTLDALLGAYRLGARMAWERFVAAGEAAGHTPATLYSLASAIFSYIDGISAESAEGFAQERAVAEGERRRLRRGLVRLLGRGDVPVEELQEAAREAGWAPRALVAAIVATGEDRAGALETALGADVVTLTEDGLTTAFLADPEAPARGGPLTAALQGAPAAVGPAVALARSAHSLARARALHALVAEGLVTDAPARCDDHLAALLLHGTDPALSAELAARALAPLRALADGPRSRLEPTLRAWLDHPGQVQRVAEDLGVHPQTVRYRVAQLRELLGERLEDPQGRFELGLALRAGRRGG